MQELRLVVLQRDNYTCQRCKKQPKISDVHHIIPLGESDGGTNDLDNLISLCPKCHKEVEPATYKGWKRGQRREFTMTREMIVTKLEDNETNKK